MEHLDAERRERFVAWFNGAPCRGDRGALTQRLPSYSKGRISQLFDEGQPFGAKAGANLATSLGLSPDAFERQPSGEQEPPRHEKQREWPLQSVPAETWDRLNERERGAIDYAAGYALLQLRQVGLSSDAIISGADVGRRLMERDPTAQPQAVPTGAPVPTK